MSRIKRRSRASRRSVLEHRRYSAGEYARGRLSLAATTLVAHSDIRGKTGRCSAEPMARRLKEDRDSGPGGCSSRWRHVMVTPAKNTICLWYNRDAEDAARFYAQ